MIKGLYWNIRGVGTSLRRLRRLIRLHQFSFIALFEPFLSGYIVLVREDDGGCKP